MVDDQVEQANAYGSYFEAVKSFNKSNNEYTQSVNEIATLGIELVFPDEFLE